VNLQMDEAFIKYDIHLARRLLIKARIARQKATIAKEFDMYFGDKRTPEARAQELLDEAKDLRKGAQALLREVERLNGQRYLAGKPVFSLKDYLVGKLFKAWDEFDVEYARIGAPLFGSDPE